MGSLQLFGDQALDRSCYVINKHKELNNRQVQTNTWSKIYRHRGYSVGFLPDRIKIELSSQCKIQEKDKVKNISINVHFYTYSARQEAE